MLKRRQVPIINEETFAHAHHPSAEKEVINRERKANLIQALDQTSDEMKDTLERIADGESLTMIADSKKIKRGTAGKQVMTARERIKRFLKGH